jgi:pimeloyl-ACP methyl ester carboxylesterase
MAAGLGLPRSPATDRFASRFHAAGHSVVAFDYRHLGDSGGTPRLVAPLRGQLADWRAAVAAAAALPEVHADRIVLWGFSVSGGHVVRVAADGAPVAAVIAQTPALDGIAITRHAIRYEPFSVVARFNARVVADAVGAVFRRAPRLVPLAGRAGELALLTTPDALDGVHETGNGEIAARSAARVIGYRPGRAASRVRCPILFVVADDDRSALPGPALRAAGRAANADVLRVRGGHYAPFLDAHEDVVAGELDFIQRTLSVAMAR